jgi:hypothetical protein
VDFSCGNFDNETKMNLLERWILIHCILYYDCDEAYISDSVFDKNMKQLNKAIEGLPKTFKRTRYYEVFKDFNPSSGYYLIPRLKECSPVHYAYLLTIAEDIIKRRANEKREPKKKPEVVQEKRGRTDAETWLKSNCGKR